MKLIPYLAALIFCVHAFSLDFVQDDSYITYRYAQRLAEGKGLTWNDGEIVEGYTSPLWTVGLGVAHWAGLPIIPLSQLLGVASGVGIILCLRKYPGAALFVALNPFMAFWAVSGMESVFFTLLITLSIFTQRSEKWRRFTPYVLILLTLTRPEGLIVAIVFAVFTFKRSDWKDWLAYALAVAALYAVRYSYYGSLVPNTALAKTGLSIEYLRAGLDYALAFGRDGLLLGAVLIPILFIVKRQLLLVSLLVVWLIYVIAVGGDVLHGYRFFVPMTGIIGILVWEGLPKNYRWPIMAAASVAVLWLNLDYVQEKRAMERGLVEKMTIYAKALPESCTVAASTIGALGYYAPTVTVVDMLGLCDKHIATSPNPVKGIESNWRERKYDAAYVLNRAPIAIIFSTGFKPSAPAERALFAYGGFIHGYQPAELGEDGLPCYVRIGNYPAGEPGPAEWVNHMVSAFNRLRVPDSARVYWKKAIDAGMPKEFELGWVLARESGAK